MYEESGRWTNLDLPVECVSSFGGVFSFILLLALPLAVLLTWLTIRLFKSNISRVMRQVSAQQVGGDAKSLPQSPEGARLSPLSLQIFNEHSAIPVTGATSASYKKLKQTSMAYALAGLAQAVVVSALTFVLSSTEFLPIRFASTVFLYFWPVVPTLILTSISDPRVKWASLGGYFLLLISLDLSLNVSGVMQGSNPGALVGTWMIWMGPPSLLLWVLSNRAWRSVGLLAYLVSAALVAGWLVSTQGLACLALALNDVSVWSNYRWPVLIGILALTGGVAWWVLKRISTRYRQRKLSDQSLTLDSWWLVITLVEIVIQFDATQGSSISFLLGFLLYLWVSRRLMSSSSEESSSSLLLLRVFGHRRRSRKLLDQLSQRWRFLGPINLIGAPDVASTNLEPDELIQFWGGQGQDMFVSSHEELHRRLENIDDTPDPDGRFRINDFFCYENTWRETVRALANTTDAILMDLRGFGPENRGCEFELGLLITDVPLNKTMLLIDASTDKPALEQLLLELWGEIPESSRNSELKKPTLRIFEASGPVHSIKHLLSLLTNKGL